MQRLLELESDPVALEQHYRNAPRAFEVAFRAAFEQRPESPVFKVWQARLTFAADAAAVPAERVESHWLLWIAGLVFAAGTLARLPDLVVLLGGTLPEDQYYARNAGFFVLAPMAVYFALFFGRPVQFIAAAAALFAAACVYINVLPDIAADTSVLALLHLPLCLWALLGLVYVGTYRHEPARRLLFLRYNGEMLVYTALILIAGGILSGLTIALFHLIGLDIADAYMENVGVYGLAGAPIVATLLATTHYGVSQRIAPIIARLFAPLALVTLVVYLGAIVTRETSLFEDREMLAVLNVVLVAVLALIVFSISEHQQTSRFTRYVGAGLLAVAVVLDLVALSAIVARLLDGLTPNRLAVLGANVLILIHLALLFYRYVRMLYRDGTLEQIEHTVTWYLSAYVVWAVLVTFGFPVLFGFA